jgi:hypothetical protein
MRKLIILVCLILNVTLVYGRGGVDGGGGNGVVCRDQAGKITDVRMLDLYEGEILYGLQFSDRFNDIESALKEVATKLHKPYLEYSFLAAYQNFKMLPTGVRLEPIDDSGHIFIPANCKIEQVANYYNANAIYVVSDFYNKMSLTDQVGLIVHEALYATDRVFNVENSRYARRVTAHAISDNFQFEDPAYGAPTKKGLMCVTPTSTSGIGNRVGNYVLNPNLKKATSFWAIPINDSHNNWRFQFLTLNGHTVYSKTYIDVDIDDNEFDFPMLPLVNNPSNGNGISSYSTLTSKFDVGQSFGYEFKNEEVNLDMFTGPTPTPGPWMNNWSSNYMYLSWIGFDPGDEVQKAQFLCTEVTLYP